MIVREEKPFIASEVANFDFLTICILHKNNSDYFLHMQLSHDVGVFTAA